MPIMKIAQNLSTVFFTFVKKYFFFFLLKKTIDNKKGLKKSEDK